MIKDKFTSLSWETLDHQFDIDPQNGSVKWKNPAGRRASFLRGKEAGHHTHKFGYVMICINGKHYKRHRLIWFYVHKKWPSQDLDHINGIRNDDRIDNLREATRSQNMWNVPLSKQNKSGTKGVSWSKQKNSWRVVIKVNGKQHHIGFFKDKDEAAVASMKAEKMYHGEFYREQRP